MATSNHKNSNMKDPAPAEDEHAFLGEEFLTWLWWRGELGEAEFTISGNRRAGVALDAPLLLRSHDEDPEGKRPEQILKFGRPLRGAEAATALRRGKLLCRAKMILSDGSREWNCTFDAQTFTLRGLRVPEEEAGEESADAALERVAAFEEAIDIVDEIFKFYLTERLSPKFRETEFPRMRKWAAEKTAV